MDRIPTLTPCLVLVLALLPGSTLAQGSSPAPDASARLAALESTVAALQRAVAALQASSNSEGSERAGNEPQQKDAASPFKWFESEVFDGDLVGTYSILWVGGTANASPERTTYMFKGAATFRPGGTGTMTGMLGGSALSTGAVPDQAPSSGTTGATIELTWALDGPTRTLSVQPVAVLEGLELLVVDDAQTLVGAKSQDNTHQLFIFTRQP
jgi:hypothetical protein